MWKYLQLPHRICCQFPFPYRFAEGKQKDEVLGRNAHLVAFCTLQIAKFPGYGPLWSPVHLQLECRGIIWICIPFIWKILHLDPRVWIRGMEWYGPTLCFSFFISKEPLYDLSVCLFFSWFFGSSLASGNQTENVPLSSPVPSVKLQGCPGSS